MTKQKIYYGSLMAWARIHPLAPPGGEYIEHTAFLMVTDSISAARKEAERLALQAWPREESWHNHTHTIYPAPVSAYREILGAQAQGLLDIMAEDSEGSRGRAEEPDSQLGQVVDVTASIQ